MVVSPRDILPAIRQILHVAAQGWNLFIQWLRAVSDTVSTHWVNSLQETNTPAKCTLMTHQQSHTLLSSEQLLFDGMWAVSPDANRTGMTHVLCVLLQFELKQKDTPKADSTASQGNAKPTGSSIALDIIIRGRRDTEGFRLHLFMPAPENSHRVREAHLARLAHGFMSPFTTWTHECYIPV